MDLTEGSYSTMAKDRKEQPQAKGRAFLVSRLPCVCEVQVGDIGNCSINYTTRLETLHLNSVLASLVEKLESMNREVKKVRVLAVGETGKDRDHTKNISKEKILEYENHEPRILPLCYEWQGEIDEECVSYIGFTTDFNQRMHAEKSVRHKDLPHALSEIPMRTSKLKEELHFGDNTEEGRLVSRKAWEWMTELGIHGWKRVSGGYMSTSKHASFVANREKLDLDMPPKLVEDLEYNRQSANKHCDAKHCKNPALPFSQTSFCTNCVQEQAPDTADEIRQKLFQKLQLG